MSNDGTSIETKPFCDEPGCDAFATHRYRWPHRPEALACAEHLQMHKNIAHHAGHKVEAFELEEAVNS